MKQKCRRRCRRKRRRKKEKLWDCDSTLVAETVLDNFFFSTSSYVGNIDSQTHFVCSWQVTFLQSHSSLIPIGDSRAPPYFG